MFLAQFSFVSCNPAKATASYETEMSYQDDHIYIQRIRLGDKQAFSCLVEKHKAMVFTMVFGILKSREDAEEVAQDAFIKAYKSLAGFKGTAKFSTWLYRIAYTTAISRTRRKVHEYTAISNDMVERYSTDDIHENMHNLDDEERYKIVEMVLSQLTDGDQLLIQLFYHKSQSIEEIASITGLSSSNVKVKLFRIRRKMAVEIQGILDEQKKELA